MTGHDEAKDTTVIKTRTDIHRPSAPEFDPQAYDLVDVFDLAPEWGGDQDRIDTVNSLIARGYHFAGSTAGGAYRCGHCGANIRYAALMIHANGHDMLYVGQDCLANRFDGVTRDQFQQLRKAAAAHRDRDAKTNRIAALVDEHPLLAELTYPSINDWATGFISDISWTFCTTGRLSDRQIEAVETAILHEIKCRDRDAQLSAEDAEEDAIPVPVGKFVIEGEVLTTRWQDNAFGGGAMKMLVLGDEGWKVWGTVSSSIDPDRGDRVRFTATVTASNDDPSFGFFSRPTKAAILKKEGCE